MNKIHQKEHTEHTHRGRCVCHIRYLLFVPLITYSYWMDHWKAVFNKINCLYVTNLSNDKIQIHLVVRSHLCHTTEKTQNQKVKIVNIDVLQW